MLCNVACTADNDSETSLLSKVCPDVSKQEILCFMCLNTSQVIC